MRLSRTFNLRADMTTIMLAEALLRHVGSWAPSLMVPRFLAYSA